MFNGKFVNKLWSTCNRNVPNLKQGNKILDETYTIKFFLTKEYFSLDLNIGCSHCSVTLALKGLPECFSCHDNRKT